MALNEKQKEEVIRLIAASASYGKVTSTTIWETTLQFDSILTLCRLHSGKITLDEYINEIPDPVVIQFRTEHFNK